MSISKNVRLYIPVSVLALLLLVSLACGGTTSPTLVATAPSGETPAASAATTMQPTQTAPDVSSPRPTQVAPSPVAPEAYNIGDIVSIGDSVLTVLGWEDVAGDQFSKPESGNKFIAVDVLIVNQGQSATSISSLMQTSLKDETSQKYTVDLLASTVTKGGSIDGELSPGERVRGKIGFQVPENVQGLQFVFDADIFGAGKVFVNLGEEPIAVEPPAEIAGETEQQTFNVGDTIEIGTLMLTVNEITYPAGDQFNKPSAGNKYLVVDLTIENKGTSAAGISTLLQMWVKDSTGQKFTMDLMATTAAKGATPDGELAAGEKVRGQVGFQVPENATGLVFVFDGDVFGAGKVFVALP